MEACKYKLPLFIIHISLVAQVEKLKKQVSYTIHLEWFTALVEKCRIMGILAKLFIEQNFLLHHGKP